MTIGQDLRPTEKQMSISRYYTPEEFTELRSEALNRGFTHVESGPLGRTSYQATRQTLGLHHGLALHR